MTASLVAGSNRAETVPDYDKPASEFAAAPFETLASEFLDEHTGRYFVFDGRYMSHGHGLALIDNRGMPAGGVTNLMSAVIAGPVSSGAPRALNVVWSQEDRELGMPFLNLQPHAPVRIYAYVLPANHRAHLKSRQGRFWKGVPVPIVLLIKALPLTSQ